jgi:hypothetical protein
MKKPIKPPKEPYVDYLDPEEIVSSNECTGLVPTPPQDDDQSKSYENLCTIPKQGKFVQHKDNK